MTIKNMASCTLCAVTAHFYFWQVFLLFNAAGVVTHTHYIALHILGSECGSALNGKCYRTLASSEVWHEVKTYTFYDTEIT